MAPAFPARAGSLSLRLLAFAGAAIAVALALAWAVLGTLFERHAERQLQAELERHGIALIAALSLDPQGMPQLERRPPDPRFERPGSGLYWLLTGPGGYLDHVPPAVPVVLVLAGVEQQPDSIGLFGFTGRAMEHPRLPLVVFCSRDGDGLSLRAAFREEDQDDGRR